MSSRVLSSARVMNINASHVPQHPNVKISDGILSTLNLVCVVSFLSHGILVLSTSKTTIINASADSTIITISYYLESSLRHSPVTQGRICQNPRVFLDINLLKLLHALCNANLITVRGITSFICPILEIKILLYNTDILTPLRRVQIQ